MLHLLQPVRNTKKNESKFYNFIHLEVLKDSQFFEHLLYKNILHYTFITINSKLGRNIADLCI